MCSMLKAFYTINLYRYGRSNSKQLIYNWEANTLRILCEATNEDDNDGGGGGSGQQITCQYYQ